MAPFSDFMIEKLLKISTNVKFFAYNIIVPTRILMIPKYWKILRFSFKIIDEKTALKSGENDKSGTPAFSRRGDFQVNEQGQLADGTGSLVLDDGLQPIILPAFKSIDFAPTGQIFIQPLGEVGLPPVEIATIGTAVPAEEIRLKKSLDGHIRIEPNINENGQEEIIPIETNQQAKLLVGFLEKSNVNIVNEMVNSIDQQRKFEMHIKFIQMAEELDQAGSNLMRLPNF